MTIFKYDAATVDLCATKANLAPSTLVIDDWAVDRVRFHHHSDAGRSTLAFNAMIHRPVGILPCSDLSA